MNKTLALKLALLFFILSFGAKAQQTKLPFTFTEISYGIYTSQKVQSEVLPGTSIAHNVVDKQVLIKTTTRVPAAIGSDFGVEYKITGKENDTVTLEIEWIYPHEITDSKNNKLTSIRYPIQLPCNAINASNYSLEDDFEVVKGKWQLNIYYGGEVIYSKNFYLY